MTRKGILKSEAQLFDNTLEEVGIKEGVLFDMSLRLEGTLGCPGGCKLSMR